MKIIFGWDKNNEIEVAQQHSTIFGLQDPTPSNLKSWSNYNSWYFSILFFEPSWNKYWYFP